MKIGVICPKCNTQNHFDTNALCFCIRCGNRLLSSCTDNPESTIPPSATESTIPPSRPESTISPTDSSPAKPWKIGDTILDLYQVKGILGEGGMGKVYRLYHKDWDMDLAVKSPLAKFMTSQSAIENFVAEAETWVNLGLHPNIVSCYYVRKVDEIPRIFVECIEGGSLLDWIRGKDDAPPRLYQGESQKILSRILDIAIQFAWGLEFAHGKDLVHQDVKPANVMMTSEGIAKVTDFGLANIRASLEQEVADTMTFQASYGGRTPAYCSPEQSEIAAQREAGIPHHQLPKLTRRTDIWSWAVSVLEMFTGEITWFAGQVAGEAFTSYLQTGADKAIPKMPDSLANILDKCFRQNPQERYSSMAEVIVDLLDCYRLVTSEKYPRSKPREADTLADSLNNQGISMLDIGKSKEAQAYFQRAIDIEPLHIEGTYNLGLLLWKTGQSDDLAIRKQLQTIQEQIRDDWRVPYWMGWLHLERYDVPSALVSFEEALRIVSDRAAEEIKKALAIAKQCQYKGPHKLATQNAGDSCLALSKNGKVAFSANRSGGYHLWNIFPDRLENKKSSRHSEERGTPHALALSPDGSTAIIGDAGSKIDLITEIGGFHQHREKDLLHGHTDKINAIALSDDTRWAISGSGDKTIRLWNIPKKECVRIFHGHKETVTSLVWSDDQRLVLSGSWDRTLRLWEVANGNCLRVFTGHTGAIRTIALSPNLKIAASGGDDQTVCLWDVETGDCRHQCQGHSDRINAVTITQDGLCCSASSDKTIRLWDIASGRCLHVIEHNKELIALAMPADGRFILAMDPNTICLWALSWPIQEQDKPVAPPALYRVWSSSEAQEQQQGFARAINAAQTAFANRDWQETFDYLNQAFAFPGCQRNPQALELWAKLAQYSRRDKFRSSFAVPVCEEEDSITAIAISADGQTALISCDDDSLSLWNLPSRTSLFQAEVNSVRSLVLNSDGKLGLSGDKSGSIGVWDYADQGKCVKKISRHNKDIQAIAVSADELLIISGSDDASVCVSDVKTGACLRKFTGPRNKVKAVAINPDNTLILSGGDDLDLRLWDVVTGKCLQLWKGHSKGIRAVAFSGNGRIAISASDDQTLRVWGVLTGKCLKVLEGHENVVSSVALSKDGEIAISGSWDQKLRLWDVTSGECLQILEGHEDWITAVAMSDDARTAISGDDSGVCLLWHIDWDLTTAASADWDEGALVYLQNFITLATPYISLDSKNSDCLIRKGQPVWSERQLQRLYHTLSAVGYGWLNHQGVVGKLKSMAGIEVAAPAAESTGQAAKILLGTYEVRKLLATDANTQVHWVHHRHWHMDMALKTPIGDPSPQIQQLFERESKIWMKLGLHQKIVSFYFLRYINGVPGIFCELVDGHSLAYWKKSLQLYQGDPKSIMKIIRLIALQLAWAIEYLHELGIVHQNITPANILMTQDGILKLVGFSFAFEHSGRPLEPIEVPAHDYRSPEQSQPGSLQITMQTDIWSWAVTVMNMFPGQFSWSASCLPEKIFADWVERQTAANIDISPSFTTLLQSCLAEKPEQRPNISQVVQAMLQQYPPEKRSTWSKPAVADCGADFLNNCGVSLLELAKFSEAENYLQMALQKDLLHFQASYNYNLLLWRQAKRTDIEMADTLEPACIESDNWETKHLHALFQIARGDINVAGVKLEKAISLGGGNEVLQTVERMKGAAAISPRLGQKIEDHSDDLFSASFTSDGRMAVSTNGNSFRFRGMPMVNSLRLWKTETGKLIRTFSGHIDGVQPVAISQDGKIILSGSGVFDYSTILQVWEADSGRCLQTFEKPHSKCIEAVLLSRDGTIGISASADQTIKQWDIVKGGDCLRVFEGHSDAVLAVAMSSDAKWLVSGSRDNSLRLWEIDSGRCLRIFQGHTQAIQCVALSSDGKLAISGSLDRTIKIWEIASGSCLRTLSGHADEVTALALSSDNRMLLSGSKDTTARFWDIATGRCLRTIIGEKQGVVSVQLTQNNRLAAIIKIHGAIQICDITGYDPQEVEHLPWALAKISDGIQATKCTMAFRKSLSQARKAIKKKEYPQARDFIEQARNIPGYKRHPAVLECRARIGLYCKRGKLNSAWAVKTFQGHDASVISLGLSADGKYVVSGSSNATICVWEMATGKCLRTFHTR